MNRKDLLALLLIPILVMFACRGLPPSGSSETPGQKQVDLFVKAAEVTRHLKSTLKVIGVNVKDVNYSENRVMVKMEQPQNLRDEQVELLYLSIFIAATRAAPFSSQVSLVILIDGKAFLQMDASTTDIRAFRSGKMGEKEFVKKITVSSP